MNLKSFLTIAIAGAIIARAKETLNVDLLTDLGVTGADTAAVLSNAETLMQLPLALTTMGLLCSILGILLVKIMSAKDPASALRIGTIGAAVIFIGGSFGLCKFLNVSNSLAAAVLCGAVGGIIIGLVTEYYTGGKPVRDIAKSGETGVATIMVSGLSVGLKSVAVPLLTLAATIFVSYEFAGLYGVGLAAVVEAGFVPVSVGTEHAGSFAVSILGTVKAAS